MDKLKIIYVVSIIFDWLWKAEAGILDFASNNFSKFWHSLVISFNRVCLFRPENNEQDQSKGGL